MPGDLQAFLENREITKWIRGGGGYSYRAHFTSRAARDIDSYFEKGINQRSLINILIWTLNLNWSDKKVETTM